MSLPVLVLTPHSSGVIPAEVATHMLGERAQHTGERASLNRHLFLEGDPYTAYTAELFDLGNGRLLPGAVSRFVVDLNRYRDDCSPNGVIKVMDFDEQQLYPEGYVVTPSNREARLVRYWDTYHAKIIAELRSGTVALMVSGHSMTAAAPKLSPDDNALRPALTLMTGGDERGEPVGGRHVGVHPEQARTLKIMLEQHFAAVIEASDVPQCVALNTPWDVDELTYGYSHPKYPAAVPGFGLEFNRALYLDERSGEALPGRIKLLRNHFKTFVEEALPMFIQSDEELL